jgi:hypothetical protein
MYCSSCGANAATNLSYCKNCGANLRGETEIERKTFEMSPNILVGAVVTTFIFGMAALVSLLAAAKRLDLNEPLIYALLGACFLLILGLEGIFIRMLFSRGKVESKNVNRSQLTAGQVRGDLSAAPARELVEPPLSVTEYTTELLEPIARERKSGDYRD